MATTEIESRCSRLNVSYQREIVDHRPSQTPATNAETALTGLAYPPIDDPKHVVCRQLNPPNSDGRFDAETTPGADSIWKNRFIRMNPSEVTMTSQQQSTQEGGNPAASSCTIDQKRIGEIGVVSVSGTVDMLTAPQLEAAIAAAAADSPAAVVVDLSAVDFLASAGMGVLVAAHGDLMPTLRLVVVADGPTTSRPLKLVGIADLIELFTTLDEALAAVAA